MKIRLLFLILAFSTISLFGQNKPSHIIYNAKGKNVSYGKMLKSLSDKDIILFGELHNNPIAHWLQLELTRDLDESKDLILGAEMFETDNQYELNCYLKGESEYKELDTIARLWPNYKTDYAPLVNYAKENEIKFVATNIPRRYARMVFEGGLDTLNTLPEKEKLWIAPLPFPFDSLLPMYKNILTMMGEHGTPELVMAQATKDATMAHFILHNYETDKLFLHYNGAYHSNKYEGILWYLKGEREDLNYATITTVTQTDLSKLSDENLNLADFIICVDEDMTKTY